MLQRLVLTATKKWKIVVVTLILLALIYIMVQWIIYQGYYLTWTGFGDYIAPNGDYMRGKTLWDWMELFIIPIFLALGAFFLNRSERESESQRAEERAKLEREIATDRQQDTALQSYLDRMSELLLKEKLRTSKESEVRDVARILTLTVVRSLDPRRKGVVLRFLQEAKLIHKDESIVDLISANFESAELDYAHLQAANLQITWLKKAKLENAKLQNANLKLVNFGSACLRGASLERADLQNAIMHYADLSSANFQDANMESAKLQGAILKNTNLSGVNLSQADLTGAEVSDEQLATAKSLKGTIMPNGTVHD